MVGEESNWAVHLAHTLPVSNGGVYTVLGDGEDGTPFDHQHATALAAITGESLMGMVPSVVAVQTSGSEEEEEEEWEVWEEEEEEEEVVQQGEDKSNLDKMLKPDGSPNLSLHDPWLTEKMLECQRTRFQLPETHSRHGLRNGYRNTQQRSHRTRNGYQKKSLNPAWLKAWS
jgi:hypothetical protein